MKATRALFCLGAVVLFAGCNLRIRFASSLVSDLREEVASHDAGRILRAFHGAIYEPYAKMEISLPAIRSYLHDPDPWVRYLAAETLYTVGDQSGLATLVELVDSADRIPEPLEGSNEDLRLQAARVLGKFRQTVAAPHLIQVYQKTQQDEWLDVIVSLLKKDTPPDLLAVLLTKKNSAFGIFHLSLAESPDIRTAAEELFRNPKTPSIYQEGVRQIAAWALARLTGNEEYARYLIQAAVPSIDGRKNGFEDLRALRYLGSLHHPLARETLERALDSSNSLTVETAVVNLLFNQPAHSEKARQVILRHLKGEQNVMWNWERTLQIAAKIDDPEIRAAGEAFDRRTPGNCSWRVWGVERKNWPIYTWVDDYVVEIEPQ